MHGRMDRVKYEPRHVHMSDRVHVTILMKSRHVLPAILGKFVTRMLTPSRRLNLTS